MEYITVVYYHPAYLTYMQSTSYGAVYSESSTGCSCWARWITSWNQDCQEKYQESQIHKWYPLMAESEEPLDKGGRREWKSWFKTQHSKNKDHGIKIRSHHFTANRQLKSGNSDSLYFSWSPKSLQTMIAAMILKDASSLEGKLWQT